MALMVYNFFDKKTSVMCANKFAASNTSGGVVKSEIVQNRELAKELHKPITKKLRNEKYIYLWGADLPDIQLGSNFNKGFQNLLRVIEIYCEYAWAVLLEDRKSITIINAFQKILDESGRKPNKIWVSKGSESCKDQ